MNLMIILKDETLNKIKELIQAEIGTKWDFDVYIKKR